MKRLLIFRTCAVVVTLFGLASVSAADCSLSDITIKSRRAHFVNGCTRSDCYQLKGVAVLVNRCTEAIGVQIKITGYDKTGAPMATRDLWPASIRNIPPGEYTFSLDSWLDYEKGMANFDIEPVSVKRWR